MLATSSNNNNNSNPINNSNSGNPLEKTSLADISVGEILDIYRSDTDLLKHILAAKAEEDKRRTAEELRKAEEAKLQSKFLDLHLGPDTTLLDDGGLDLASLHSHDWLSPPPPPPLQVTSDLLTPNSMNNNTPPSPTTSLLQPLSPYTLFDVPFSELKLSAPSSPETNQPQHGQFDDTENNNATCNNNSDNNNTCNTTAAPETESNIENKDAQEQPTVEVTTAPGQAQQIRERTSCKRTLSRARSHRKPSVHRASAPKKNRSQPQPEEKANDAPLDHGKVMEALRAKLQRSTEQQKELLLNPKKEEFNSMSPTGILLLDLKNPKKTFPVRPKATPRTSLVRKPSSFISAHRVKEPSV